MRGSAALSQLFPLKKTITSFSTFAPKSSLGLPQSLMVCLSALKGAPAWSFFILTQMVSAPAPILSLLLGGGFKERGMNSLNPPPPPSPPPHAGPRNIPEPSPKPRTMNSVHPSSIWSPGSPTKSGLSQRQRGVPQVSLLL